MSNSALGLPVEEAKALFPGREIAVFISRPPRRPDKKGNLRVTRVKENGGTVELTVSPFEDSAAEEEND